MLSLGVATWDGCSDARALLRAANEALYQANRGGRDRAVLAGGARRPAAARGAKPALVQAGAVPPPRLVETSASADGWEGGCLSGETSPLTSSTWRG
jgi:hypothetical protein